MRKIIKADNLGSRREVHICANTEAGPFRSRLYLEHGNIGSTQHAEHKTLAGAEKWAKRVLRGEERG